MKHLFKILILLFLFLGMERLCHRATDGFSLTKIYAPKGDNARWKHSDFPEAALLNQPYYYLTSGSQCYVFVSEDQRTVLKLFKFQHMRTPPFLDFLPSIGILKKKRLKKRQIFEKTLDSYFIAYHCFRKETGLLFIHLTKTNHLRQKLTIFDKIGKCHILDLNQVEFILQKRGTLAYQTLTQWMKNGEKEKAQRGILNLLNLVLKRCLSGIFDKDPNFKTNFGFINDEIPFQIDIGQLSLSEKEKDPHIYRPEMIRITREFENWIAVNYPDLLKFFNESLNELIF